MVKSSTSERNKRINHTIRLLGQISSSAQVVTELVRLYNVSHRQAYRYIEEAQGAEHILPIPEKKVVFTVKLPKSLVHRLRECATSTGQSLSDLTSQALENFLYKGEGRG